MRRAVAALALTPLALAACGSATGATPREWTCSGYVALTYDDGPSEYTTAVADALEEEGMRATFFLLGENVQTDPEAVARLRQGGHALATHTLTHPDLVADWHESILADEVVAGAEALEEVTGEAPKWFRPPYGATDARVREGVEAAGMTEVIWTLDTFDWQGLSAEEVAAVFDEATDGDIVLMHDSSQVAVDAVPLIADRLADRGLCAGAVVPATGEVVVWEGLSHSVTAGSWEGP